MACVWRNGQITIINKRNCHTVAHRYNWTFSSATGLKPVMAAQSPWRQGRGCWTARELQFSKQSFFFLDVLLLPSRQGREGSWSHAQGPSEVFGGQVLLEETRGQRSQSSPGFAQDESYRCGIWSQHLSWLGRRWDPSFPRVLGLQAHFSQWVPAVQLEKALSVRLP